MSTRVNLYISHQFHITWETAKKEFEKLNKSEITDDMQLIEIARIEKIVVFIDSYLKVIEPDLNNNNINQNLNNMNSYSNSFQNAIVNYSSSRNSTYLSNANTNLDNIIGQLRTLNIGLPKFSGRSISSMLKKYNDTLDKALKEIDLDTVKTNSKEIKEYKEQLFTDYKDIESINAEIYSTHNSIKEKDSEINEFYNTTFNSSEYNNTTKELISNAKDDVIEIQKKVKDELQELSEKIESFEEYYKKIFGELNEEGLRVGGLKKEIDSQKIELNKFEKEQEQKHKDILEKKLEEIKQYETDTQQHTKNLHKQIESHLPGATSAGLAKAYQKEREKFIEPIRNWNIIFITSLIIMFLTSFYTLGEVNTVDDMAKQIFHSIPLLAPLIWLAIYSSKRRSENQRLEQEYAHKEALASSYSSYKMQIEALKEDDHILLKKLLESSIETVSKNASESLDKKHGDGMPTTEIINKIVDVTTKAIKVKE
ncbi:MICOS complex subunit MIC60 [Poseidonibacter lekithochrous]|uniref:hypothetical protein n=1 Tax=Poseidonibacter lekithochrous TaxID=1904463 RepID=UPI000D340536|nr:hypothetical protein [Poseidonibacter lekithochrous]